MSALTTLFSSLANKIRSKTGGSDTYTPPEMVDAIDDVYDAGVASATTPITPSNASPASMTSGTGYKPTANGYAIESYDSVTPSSSPASVSSGDVVKIGGSGVIVDAIPTPTSITPSNSSPATLTANTPVTPTANGKAVESVTALMPSNEYPTALYPEYIYKLPLGYSGVAIQDYTEITPSSNPPQIKTGKFLKALADGFAINSYSIKTPSSIGAYFSAGFVKMSSSGYAYSAQPTLKAATLWTNSSTTSSFSGQTVTLSNDIDNYEYIGFRYKASTSSSAETNEVIVTPANLKKSITGNSKVRMSMGCTNSSGNYYLRGIAYSSDTSIVIGDAYRMNNNSGASNTLCIPTSIVGYIISA